MSEKLTWSEYEEIGFRLCEEHPDTDPLLVRFTELRRLVEALPDFETVPGHNVNEQLLEAVQAAWHEEYQDSKDDPGDSDDEGGYAPPSPFKPD